MKYYILCLTVYLLINIHNESFCQQNLADSLENKLTTSTGIEKVTILNELADTYQFINTQIAIQYAQQGIELADSIKYLKGKAGCLGSLGFAYINLDRDEAIKYTKRALEIRRELNDKKGIATSLNVLGVIYYYSGDYILSIENHIKGMNLREEIGDEVSTATSYNNLALVYYALEDYDTSLKYFSRALDVRIKNDNKRGIGIIKSNIGNIYAKKGKTEEAFKYYFDALRINQEIGTQKSEANSYFSIAGLYKAINNFDEAFKYYRESLKIYKNLDEKNGIANAENGLAELHRRQGNCDSAIIHANTALNYAKEINSLENIVNSSDVLQDCYSRKGNYQLAHQFLSQYLQVYDSLKSDPKLKQIAKIELDYKLKQLQEEQEAKLNQQKLFNQFLVLILILALIIVVMFYKQSKTRKKLNNKLNVLNKSLEKSMSEKDRFFSLVSHDLRSPFTGLFGFLDLLKDDYESLSEEEKKEIISSIHASTKNVYSLIENFLEWSQIQRDLIDYKPRDIIVKPIIENVVELYKSQASLKNISISVNVDEKITVFSDEYMLKTIIRNLLSNAVKFSSKGENIEIKAEQNFDGTVLFSVKDNGLGMDKDTSEKLFQIDQHISTIGTANEKGTGLGLILCKEFIEMNNGNIWIDSTKGLGSTFYFTLNSNK